MKYKTKYSRNDTMKQLGKQKLAYLFTPELFKELDEIREANEDRDITELVIDAFTWGYINGQRAERKKKLN